MAGDARRRCDQRGWHRSRSGYGGLAGSGPIASIASRRTLPRRPARVATTVVDSKKKTDVSDIPFGRDLRLASSARELVIERTIPASSERVFDAFTGPAQLTQWWWPEGFTCPAAEVDLRVGGTYRIDMRWPDAIAPAARFSHYLGGEYYEIDRPRRLVMSGRAVDDHQGELFATLIELTLVPVEGGTALTMRQSYFEPLPPAPALAGAEQGWSEQLDKLTRLLTA